MDFKKGDELNIDIMNTGLFEAVIVENDEKYLDVEYRFKATNTILNLEEAKQLLKILKHTIKVNE